MGGVGGGGVGPEFKIIMNFSCWEDYLKPAAAKNKSVAFSP